MLTDVYHERDPRAFDNYMMRELPVIRRLVEQSRAPHFVIKCLCELDRLPALMSEFQPSKALWIVREYRDAVNSALVSFGRFSQQIDRIVRRRDPQPLRPRRLLLRPHIRIPDAPTHAAVTITELDQRLS